MKKFQIGWIFVLAILFSACGAHYNNIPSQRLTAQQGHWVLLPGADKPVLTYDSVYIMSPTWWQASEWAKQDGSYPWFWILLVAGPVAGYLVYYFATRKQPAQSGLFLAILLVCGGIWVCAYLVLDSKRWSSDQEVPKTIVDSVLKKDGDTHAIWQNFKPL